MPEPGRTHVQTRYGVERISLQTLLGFDYGSRRIGVAVGQEVTGTATALCTIPTRRGTPDWDRLDALVAQWQPGALVVGLPSHADGSDSDMTRAARRFARQLESRYSLPAHLADERLSSHAAAGLRQQATAGKRAGTDAIAARIILQDWLDTRPS